MDQIRNHLHRLRTFGGPGDDYVFKDHDANVPEKGPWIHAQANDSPIDGHTATTFDAGGSETRPLNVAFHPRIHC